MRDVAIIGAGMTKFGRSPGDLMEIMAEASLRAIKHANVEKEEFDALYVSNMMAGETSHQTAESRMGLRREVPRLKTPFWQLLQVTTI
ncbi:MAG: hypothetical protein QW495_04160 [Candidatus Hadarchaeum sp.]